jgi:hypothetical protein
MGWCNLAFAVAFLGCLLLYHVADLVDMTAAIFGDAAAVDSLRSHRLTGRAVFLTLVPFCLEVMLMGVLLWSAFGLLTMRGSARWSALFFGGVAIPLALAHSVLHLVWLTVPEQVIALGPLLLDAILIQFAIVLCGTMFLPSVVVAYQADLSFEEPAGYRR